MEWSRVGAKQIPEPWLLMTSPAFLHWIILTHWGQTNHNKANLRDLIAATGLVISNWIQIIDFFPLKFDGWLRKTIGTFSILCQALCIISIPSGEFETGVSPDTLNSDWNWRYFVLCYLEIRWMTLENNRAHLLYYRYIKLCASFQIHWWNQSCVTVRKPLIRVNIDFFVLCDLEIQWMTLKNKRAPLLYYIKLCASFQSHGWIQTGVTVRKRSIRVKISIFFVSCDLEIWQMTMKNYRVPLLCCFRLCASFHSHWWIQTGVTVRKHPIWIKINNSFYHVTLKFDGWPWEMIEHLF